MHAKIGGRGVRFRLILRARSFLRGSLLLLAGLLLSACESVKLAEITLPSEGEAVAREYAGVTAERAIEAAEKLLLLSRYYVFATPDGVIAAPPPIQHQPYGSWLHPVFEQRPPAFWTVSVVEKQGTVVVNVEVQRCFGSGAYPTTSPVYSLFFERLDYLLGHRSKWPTCAEAAAKWPGRSPASSIFALCFRTKPPAFFQIGSPDLEEPDPDGRPTQWTPDRKEWLAMTTRTYPNVTPGQLIDAARKTLARSQPGFEFRDITDGFIAGATQHHVYFLLVVAGNSDVTHLWVVRARAVADGSMASVYVTTGRSGTIATVGFHGASVYVPPRLPNLRPSVYDLFWRRLDHTLGLRSDWPTCDKLRQERMPARADRSDPICSR